MSGGKRKEWLSYRWLLKLGKLWKQLTTKTSLKFPKLSNKLKKINIRLNERLDKTLRTKIQS